MTSMPLVYQRSRKLEVGSTSLLEHVRSLRPVWKLEQLTHAMSRYHCNIVWLCKMRWKHCGEMSTDDGHKFISVEMMKILFMDCENSKAS